MKVLPVSFGFNRTHSRGRDAVFFGYFFMPSRITKYLQCDFLGKNGSRTGFAFSLGSMLDGICVIFLTGSPPKVFNAVVPRIAIVMKAHLPFCGRPLEGEQYQLVRGKHFPLSALPKLKKRAPGFGTSRLHKKADSSYISKVRYLVKALITGDRKPCFHTESMAHKGFPCPA